MRQWYNFPGYRRIRDAFDIDTVDDLIDRLETLGTAQDYPEPEPIKPLPLRDHLFDFRHSQLNDLRSRTIDLDLNQPPVPGYKDLPPSVNYQDPPSALQIPQTSPHHGRRRPQPQIRQTSRHPPKSRQGVQSSR